MLFRFVRGALAASPLVLGACATAWLLGACGSDTSTDSAKVPAKLAIVADWLQRSLSYVDVEALEQGGATHDAIVTRTIELADYAPGPLALRLTPDRKTALISVSSGFFSLPLAGTIINESNVPSDPGTLLFLDVPTGKVEGELITGESPMGIAITPDGKRAFVAHFTSGDLAVVDIENRSLVERIPLGVYPEEIALDDTGTVGIIGYSAAGSVLTFSVADPRASLTSVELEGDSAGVAFFPGTKVAFVAQAPNPLSLASGAGLSSGFTVVDVTRPQAPAVLQDERLSEAPIAYPVVQAKKRDSVLVPTTVGGRLVVREYKLVSGRAELGASIDIAEASLLAGLGAAYDEDHTLLIAWASQRALVRVDLDARTARAVPWLAGAANPSDVVFR